MARKKGAQAARRTTRRKTASEQMDCPDAMEVPEGSSAAPSEAGSPEIITTQIIPQTGRVEDTSREHEMPALPAQMNANCDGGEGAVNGTWEGKQEEESGRRLTVVAAAAAVKSESTVAETAPIKVETNIMANCETDLKLVNEIGTAITNIKIESEIDVNQERCSRGSNTVVEEEQDRNGPFTMEVLDDDDSLNIRRSSRIKTISRTKQKSRGHGLVRDREKMKLSADGDVSSPPVQSADAVSRVLPVPPPATPLEEQKPQKIKSRWLDSAKRESLDLNNSSLGIGSSDSLQVPVSAATSPPESKPTAIIDYYAPDPEVIECLKRLNQIKDNIYNCERNISKEAKKMVCDCFLTAEEKQSGEFGCGEDCLNRLLMIECGQRCVVGDRCTNRRFQTHQYAPVVVFKTEKKGFGLRAADDIQAGDFIMEYVGEVLNAKQFDKRANAYSKDKNKHYYFMALRSDAVIDATAKGNISRFINHSCDPNAETQKWTVNGELRIGFFTTRFIGKGEEVTFDYQYQRYGKEAQRCYCEAETCRGWIGEEPEEDDDEEEGEEDGAGDDEEEVEGEETDADDEESGAEEDGGDGEKQDGEKTATRKAEKGQRKKNAKGAKKKAKEAAQKKPKATAKAAKKTATSTATKAPKKPRRTARSRRQEILDDLDLDAEIDALSKTGLKNQAHTLKLSRVMVRAKLPRTRMRLLELIQGAEIPCRRLFLDYHGLRLLHGWMADAQEQLDVELKMELLRTLHVLPIPNKTMLKDSHVLTAVSNYGGLKLDSERKAIVAEEPSIQVRQGTKQQVVKKEPMEVDGTEVDDAVKLEEEKARERAEEEERAEIRRVSLENAMRALCKEMVLKWVQLPEVFRIPKKERIEQMKEHEREADMRYMTLGLQNEVVDQEKQNERRFKGKNPDDIKWVKREFSVPVNNDGMSKSQRRRLFAMQVEEQRRNQQRVDAWQHHEFRCNFFGLDPFRVRPEDVPSWVDLENRQWFTYDLTEVPTPPNYVHVTMRAPDAEDANIADYDLPKMDLPEGWEYAMDPRGRLYYFHRKIRIPQWELPIKLLPLSQDQGRMRRGHAGNGSMPNGTHAQDDEEGEDGEQDRNDDSSTTDTCDSSEEETVKRINRIKKLQKIGVARSTIVKLHLHERNSDDEVTREEVSKAEEERAATATTSASSSGGLFLGLSKKLPNREALVEYREISPRREEDRLYGQAEMKRYKETKEKVKQRKEMLKRRKLERMMRAGLISNDPEKRVSLRGIQITDDELYDETDEEDGGEGRMSMDQMNGGELPVHIAMHDVPATTTVPLMEKIVLGNSRVDELDEPHKYNEMTRLKIRERNAKRSRALKVQMKLKKMKMDEEHGEGRTVNGIGLPHNASQLNGVAAVGQGEGASEGLLKGDRLAGSVNVTPVNVTGGGAVPSGSGSISSEKAKRIKEKFRSNIAGVIVQHLSPYRRDSCPIGRITNNEDFKHLAKKLTHFVLVKELKHCATVADLLVSDSVKQKSKEFIRKYMSKYGKVYEKPLNEPDY